MNCDTCERTFAAAIEGLLDGGDRDEFDRHLTGCPACRRAYDQTAELVARLDASARATLGPSPSLSRPVGDRILREQAFQLRRIARTRRRILGVAAAAALPAMLALAAGLPSAGPRGKVLADDLRPASQAIEGAPSATWKTNYYMRFVKARGGGSKWVRIANNNQRFFYKAPGLYRRETLGEDGEVRFVAVEDVRNRTTLEYDATRKTAVLRSLVEPSFSPQGPFATFTEAMKRDDLQGLGEKQVGGLPATGYRYKFFTESANQDWSYDFWLATDAKGLVQGQVPGADLFDPADVVADQTWEPSLTTIRVDGEAYDLATTLGLGNSSFLTHDIRLDVPLDDSLFSLEAPEGYEVSTRAPVVPEEADVTEFLGVLARYFDGEFPASALRFNQGPEYERFERIERNVLQKQPATEAETAMVEAMHRWWSEGLPGPGPLHVFIQQRAEAGTWKYLGGGVKLGEADRIVCWYRPKGSRVYHVVHGDLSVKEVAPGALPLPIAR